ncbi:MAG: lamin tail domain-containing protein [Ignavibacteria bacterium]|jgi:methionine-rich copper-binding protein CopC
MTSKLFTILAVFLIVANGLTAQSGIVVTEIMFDIPSDIAGDANGDGTRGSRSDEFVEIYNSGTEAVDMSAYQLIEREGIPVFTFPIGTTLNAGQYAVVFGAVGTAGFGDNIPEGTLLFAANEGTDENVGFDNGDGKTNLSNSRDRVMLVDVLMADTLFEIYWGGSESNPIEPLSSKAKKLMAPYTLLGDSIAGAIGQSVTLDLEGSNLWGLHTIVTGDESLFFSPGERAVESSEPIPTDLIITEIMFDVPSDEAGDANGDGARGSRSDEFVEIYNEGVTSVDLTGFQLLDREGLVVFNFPDETTIDPGQFAVVFGAVGSAGFGSDLPPGTLLLSVQESDENVGFNNGDGKSNLSNSGDAVLLVNSAVSDTVCEVYWGSAEPKTSEAVYLGPPNTASGDSINGSIRQSVTRKIEDALWDIHSVISGDTLSLFSPGSDASKSPAVITGDLIITEIMFDVPSDEAGDANGDGTRGSRSDEFIELYNRGTTSINLEGYQILETNGIPIFTFPEGAAIDPGQFSVIFGAVGTAGFGTNIPTGTVLFAQNESDENVGFDNGDGKSNLSNSGDAILLVNPTASDTLMEVYWGSTTALTSDAIYIGYPNTVSGDDISGGISQSITHLLDSDKWDLHTVVTGSDLLFSPGSNPEVTAVEKTESLPGQFNLFQNYPNPFNPSTTIKFNMNAASKVSLKIYNILGKEVDVLINNEELSAGVYTFDWHPVGLASGVYFYKLITGSYTNTKKMILIK